MTTMDQHGDIIVKVDESGLSMAGGTLPNKNKNRELNTKQA